MIFEANYQFFALQVCLKAKVNRKGSRISSKK
jgi:hypothetical protein